jgi:hypothetical protein
MPQSQGPTPPKTWKQRLGLALAVYSFVPVCTVGLSTLLPVPATWKVTFGAVYLASGELAFLAAVALLGKPFVTAVKDKIRSWLAPRRAPKPPRPISHARHVAGVTLFCASIIPYYLTLGALLFTRLGEPDLRSLLVLLLAGEVLFFVSLFVLGEEFWARLKHLFEWPGREASPPTSGSRDHGA